MNTRKLKLIVTLTMCFALILTACSNDPKPQIFKSTTTTITGRVMGARLVVCNDIEYVNVSIDGYNNGSQQGNTSEITIDKGAILEIGQIYSITVTTDSDGKRTTSYQLENRN